MSWTKAQHVEAGTWWDQPGDPPQSVLDARARHGFNPDLSPASAVKAEPVKYQWDLSSKAVKDLMEAIEAPKPRRKARVAKNGSA